MNYRPRHIEEAPWKPATSTHPAVACFPRATLDEEAFLEFRQPAHPVFKAGASQRPGRSHRLMTANSRLIKTPILIGWFPTSVFGFDHERSERRFGSVSAIHRCPHVQPPQSSRPLELSGGQGHLERASSIPHAHAEPRAPNIRSTSSPSTRSISTTLLRINTTFYLLTATRPYRPHLVRAQRRRVSNSFRIEKLHRGFHPPTSARRAGTTGRSTPSTRPFKKTVGGCRQDRCVARQFPPSFKHPVNP